MALVFPFNYRSSDSLSDRYSEVFNVCETTGVVILDIAKIFESVWYSSLLNKLSSYGILGRVLGLTLSFPNKTALIGSRWEDSQELTINPGIPSGHIQVQGFSHFALMTFLVIFIVILLSMLMSLLIALTVDI